MEKLSICVVCGSKNITKKTKINDHAFSNKEFGVSKCNSCLVLFTNPRPRKKELIKYYDLNKYDSYATPVGLWGGLYRFSQKINNYYKVGVLKKHHKGSLLDYGSGSGSFVEYSNQKGFVSMGYEPINKARTREVVNTDEYLNNKYDWITMWHVLEHTNNPTNTVKKLSGLLKKGGHIAIALPNNSSYDNFYYKNYWAGYDVPRHLFHFNRKSFFCFSKYLKLEIIEERPLLLDSIYVSMLSEKYKKNPLSYLFGFIVGLISNISALITGNYSSIIYILRKC